MRWAIHVFGGCRPQAITGHGVAALLCALALAACPAGGQNLIVNGDFEAGETGFTSDYSSAFARPLDHEGGFAVGNDPADHRSDTAFNGVSAFSGTEFLMANGSSDTTDAVWQGENLISVTQANTAYRFEAQITTLFPINVVSAPGPILQFEIGDGTTFVPLGTSVTFTGADAKGVWKLAFIDGTFDAAGNYVIRLVNQQPALSGNDFAIDALYFGLSADAPSVGGNPVGTPGSFSTAGLTAIPNIDTAKSNYTVAELTASQVGSTFEGGVLRAGAGATLDHNFVVLAAGGTIDTNGHGLTLTGDLLGDGALVKRGEGTLRLSGDNSYAGDTTVMGGTLIFDGAGAAPNGDVIIDGGVLSGLVGGNNLTVRSGRVAPGNSIGTMVVSGTYELNGGTYEVELSNAAADKIVADDAVLTSGTILAAPTELITTTVQHTIIETTGGIVGDPNSLSRAISDTSFLLDFDLSVVGNDLVLTTTPVGTFLQAVNADAAATNPNLRGIAIALDRGADGGLGGAEMTQAQMMTQPQLVKLVGQSQPRAREAAQRTGLHQRHAVRTGKLNRVQAIQTAMRSERHAQRRHALADAAPHSSAMASVVQAERLLAMRPGSLAFWGRSLNGFGDVDSDRFASGFDYRSHGFDIGVETLIDEHRLLGGSIAAAWTDLDGDSGSGSAELANYWANVYVAWIEKDWQLTVGGAYGIGRTDTRRPIAGLGLTAEGDYDSDIYSGFLSVSRVFETERLSWEPFVVVDYAHVVDDAYTESGAGGMNLSVSRNGTDSLRTLVGVRLAGAPDPGQTSGFYPHVSVAWEHEHLDDQVANDATLVGSTFRSLGLDVERDSLRLGVGAVVRVDSNLSLFVDHTSLINADFDAHSIEVGLRILF